jgi:hypothetical protein
MHHHYEYFIAGLGWNSPMPTQSQPLQELPSVDDGLRLKF